MNGYLDTVLKVAGVCMFVLRLAKWIDAYRLATDIPLPLPVEWRVLLARYNLLAVSTHIYKAFEAMKKPTSSG